MPWSKEFHDVPSFLKSQGHWFEGKTGTWDYRILRLEASDEVGLCLGRADYANVDEKGVPFRLDIFITYVFRRRNGKWFLVHIQNTVQNRAP